MRSNRFLFIAIPLLIGVTGCNITPMRNTNNGNGVSVNPDLMRMERYFHVENGGSASEVAKIMEQRLKKTKTVNFQVEVQDAETIRVAFDGKPSEDDLLSRYLVYDGTATLSNSIGTYSRLSEFIDPNKEAFYTEQNGAYSIVIPIDNSSEMFKAVYLEAKEMNDNGTGEVEIESEDIEGEESEHQHKAFLYLWYNFVEDIYTYDKIDQNSPETYDPMIASDVLMTFDAADPFLDESHNALRTYIKPSNGDVVYASLLANYFVGIINAGPLNYQVSIV